MKKLFRISRAWFLTETPWWLKLLLVYVKGDMIILLPFLVCIAGIGLFSLKWMLVIVGLYASLRFLGEMMYWLLQQFGSKTYRPYDYGFKNLDNEAIYILYQTFSLVSATISSGFVVWVLVTWK